MKRILSMVLGAFLVVGTLAACAAPAATPQQAPGQVTGQQQAQPPAAAPGGQQQAQAPQEQNDIGRGIILAIASETPSVAPARHSALIGHFKNVTTHNGLFRAYYATLEPVLDLAESWTAISDTVFEFRLHQGILFHNGEELTAYDVEASLWYVRNYPEARANHTSVYATEVIDRYTIRIDTGVPHALFFNEMAHQANFIMPKSLIEAGNDFQANPVGSGPFVFEDWRFGDSLMFSRFNDYFDTDRAARVEYLNWRIIPEGSSRTIALETGEVDLVIDVAFPDVPRLIENPDITVFQRPGAGYGYLLLNNDIAPFDNIYVRRAIDMAIDKEAAVIASLDGFGVPIWELMPNIFPGYSSVGIRSFDPDGARALLAEQGIDPATISFDMLASSEEQRRRGEVVQSNLADIGIQTTITMIDFASWLDVTAVGDYEAAFGAMTSGSVLGFLRATHHESMIDGQNRARIRHPEITALIDQALETVDATARFAILEQASRLANEHVGFIPTQLSILLRAFDSNLAVPEIAANGFTGLNMVYWLQ